VATLSHFNDVNQAESIFMFGIGMPEFLLIMAIALIVIGPKKLPELAKALGKALGEFKKATSELKDSLEIDKPLSDVKRSFDNLNKDFNKSELQNSIDKKELLKDSTPKVQNPSEQHTEKTEAHFQKSEKKTKEPDTVLEKEVGQKMHEPKGEKNDDQSKV
jgi:sec-independent protein translocase protein TatB